MNYVDFYSLFNFPEKDWEDLLAKMGQGHMESQLLFEQRGLVNDKSDSTTARTIAEHMSVERYEFYRTAIIKTRANLFGDVLYFRVRLKTYRGQQK